MKKPNDKKFTTFSGKVLSQYDHLDTGTAASTTSMESFATSRKNAKLLVQNPKTINNFENFQIKKHSASKTSCGYVECSFHKPAQFCQNSYWWNSGIAYEIIFFS